MNRVEELKLQIEDWQHRAFLTNMSDHLSREDYQFLDKCSQEIKKLKEEIRRIENE